SNLSRVSIIILRGESFLPVLLAGHSSVHRPHSVQVYAFNSWIRFKSITSLAPNLEGASTAPSAGAANGSTVGSIIIFTSFVTDCRFLNFPFGTTFPKYTFGKAKIICKCFEKYK